MVLFQGCQTGFELIKKLKRMKMAEFETLDFGILHVSIVLHRGFPYQMWESLFIPGIQHIRRQNTSFSIFDDIYLTDELIAAL